VATADRLLLSSLDRRSGVPGASDPYPVRDYPIACRVSRKSRLCAFMEAFLLPLAAVLIAAELGGFITQHLGLTRVPGQIAAGLIIGPTVLGLVTLDGNLQMLAEVGALCVLAIAGLETDVVAIRKVGRPAMLAAVGGVALPFILGAGITRWLGYGVPASLFVGAVLTATSVGVSAAALRELRISRSAVGQTILGAAIIDDVLGLVVLALVVGMATGTSSGIPVGQLLAMTVVIAGSGALIYVFRHRLAALLHQLTLKGGGLAGMVGLVLMAAYVFQQWGGLAAITGAYVAGVAVAGSHVADGLRDRLVHAGEAFCVPVFLVAIGLSVNLQASGDVLIPTVMLFALAVVGKVIGCGLGARLGGLEPDASVGVGIGMIARGEVALVAASLGLSSGVLDQRLYAACVVMALGTTVVTPILLAVWASRSRIAALAASGMAAAAEGVQATVAAAPATVAMPMSMTVGELE